MARFLVKTEPSDFAFVDLVRDGRVTWDGVRNPVAQRHLKAMRKGDDVLVYHTGSQKAVVGLARVAADPKPEAGDTTGKFVGVELTPVAGAKNPVTLSSLREEPRCAEFVLLHQPRLSVMPVPAAAWAVIRKAAGF
jgi:predicted RNA-binding protein with PUA-like domain